MKKSAKIKRKKKPKSKKRLNKKRGIALAIPPLIILSMVFSD